MNDTKLDYFYGYRLGDVGHHVNFKPEQYVDRLHFATLGTAYSSIMGDPYWEYMIGRGISAWCARQSFVEDSRFIGVTYEERGLEWRLNRFGVSFHKDAGWPPCLHQWGARRSFDPDFRICNRKYKPLCLIRNVSCAEER